MIALPPKRTPAESVLATMQELRQHDAQWQQGKTWSYVYHAGDDVAGLLGQAYSLFISENGFSPMAFPSLRKFETEVVSMTSSLLGGDDETVGNMTSGGTESILLAVKSARDWARAKRPSVTAPEMVLPLTAHPAFEKAAQYFCVKSVRTPVGEDFRADVEAVGAALSPNTILLVGSAPSYPHGVIDPIEELARLAQNHEVLFHVDACVGGLMLPFVRRLGYDLPDFDLGVPGVTSLSADLHKYGYAAKGSSVILYKSKIHRRHQFSVYTDWPGGIYLSPTMLGTRPGGAIAAAWAVMNYLGEEGYLALADGVMKSTTQIRDGIDSIEGLQVLGNPAMSVLAIGSEELDIYEVGDELTLQGWHLDRQQYPASLHLTVIPTHAQVIDRFLEDLRQAASAASRLSAGRLGRSLAVGLTRTAVDVLPAKVVSSIASRSASALGLGEAQVPARSAAIYGMMAALPNRGDVEELVLDLLEQISRPQEEPPSPEISGIE
jgi:glutamate/tyrosine decarboxylase-like PLP-dependent enzyme